MTSKKRYEVTRYGEIKTLSDYFADLESVDLFEEDAIRDYAETMDPWLVKESTELQLWKYAQEAGDQLRDQLFAELVMVRQENDKGFAAVKRFQHRRWGGLVKATKALKEQAQENMGDTNE